MDDSSLFMQWAMNTLQHQHPPSAGDALPPLQELRNSASPDDPAPAEAAAQDGHRHSNSWSSGDTDSGGGGGTGTSNPSASVMEHDGWSPPSVQCVPSSSVGSTNYRPVSWNFTMAMPQPTNGATPNLSTAPSRAHDGGGVMEVPLGPPPSRRSSAKSAAGTEHTPPAPHAQGHHIMAERKRREKINQRFIELSTVIPGLKKMDKATILSDALRYVKELQEKLKALEDRNGRSIESAVLAKKPCIAPPDYKDGSCAAAAVTAGTARNSLPEIEVRISEGDVMLRIHCENAKGVLARLLAEVEGLHLTLVHTNVIPFPSRTIIITVMAKMEDGCKIVAEDIVGRLNCALHQRNTGNTSATEEN